jgi:hypothetical protein
VGLAHDWNGLGLARPGFYWWLPGLLARINCHVQEWIRAKYRRLRVYKAMKRAWSRITTQMPGLLPHWRRETGPGTSQPKWREQEEPGDRETVTLGAVRAQG